MSDIGIFAPAGWQTEYCPETLAALVIWYQRHLDNHRKLIHALQGPSEASPVTFGQVDMIPGGLDVDRQAAAEPLTRAYEFATSVHRWLERESIEIDTQWPDLDDFRDPRNADRSLSGLLRALRRELQRDQDVYRREALNNLSDDLELYGVLVKAHTDPGGLGCDEKVIATALAATWPELPTDAELRQGIPSLVFEAVSQFYRDPPDNPAYRRWLDLLGFRPHDEPAWTVFSALREWALAELSRAEQTASVNTEEKEPVQPTKQKRRRRRDTPPRELTPRQLEAVQVVGECENNFAEAARRIGCNRTTVQQHYQAGMKKLGAKAVKHKTQRLLKGKRGEERVLEEDDRR